MISTVADVVAGICIVTGCLLGLIAAIGLLRLPDVLSRMHAATKPQVLGVVLVMIGVALRLHDSVDVWMVVLVAAFQVLTAPIAAHLVGRLAYRTRHMRRDLLDVDELAPHRED